MSRGNHSGGRSRADLTSTTDRLHQEYDEATGHMHDTADDSRVEDEAIGGFAGMGTTEGLAAVMASLQEAKAATQREFTEEADTLQGAQAEGETFEGGLREGAESTSADLERVNQARQQVKSDAASALVERAAEATREDVEFLHSEEKRAGDAREAGIQISVQLRQIVFGAGG